MSGAATMTPTGATVTEASALLDARAAAGREPAFLRARRQEALETFKATRMPDPLRDEEWRRTSLDGLDLAARPAEAADAFHIEAGKDALPAGAVVCSLAEAALSHPALVERHLGATVPAARGKLEALSLALFDAGSFVYVPRDTTVERTILIRGKAAPRPGAAGFGAFRRSLVVLEKGARATVVVVLESTDDPGLVSSALEVVLGDGAHLRHATVQVLGAAAWSFETRRAQVGRDATIEWVSAELGARVSRSAVESMLSQEGGKGVARSMVMGDAKQHLDLGIRMLHHAPHTEGDMVVRAALAGSARAVYRGHVEIKRGARGTNNQQKEAVLLLSDAARSDAIPSLFIDENDVKAGHGATAGRVDERQLFYLMSRGIRRRAAERLIVEGFFAPLMERIDVEELRAEILRRVDAKFGADA